MNKITKRSDLSRRWADVQDMCEGTNVKPYRCVKCKYSNKIFSCQPSFTRDIYSYQFAIAIVEDKPVFVGDMLYDKDGKKFVVEESIHRDYSMNMRVIDKKIGDADKWLTNPTFEGVSVLFWNPPKDEYSELKQAQKEGKRIAWLYSKNNYNPIDEWYLQLIPVSDEAFKRFPVDRWKIIEDDKTSDIVVYAFKNKRIVVRLTESGLTGEIITKVIA